MAGDARDRILEAAQRVFASHGLFKAPLDLVAREAGVSKGLIFWYFGNKMELIMEVARRALPLDVVRGCLDEGLEGEELLRCIGSSFLEKYENPTMRALLMHSVAAEAIVPEVGEEIRRLCNALLAGAAPRAFGTDSPEARVAMRTFFGSLLCYTLRRPQDLEPEEYLDKLISIIKIK